MLNTYYVGVSFGYSERVSHCTVEASSAGDAIREAANHVRDLANRPTDSTVCTVHGPIEHTVRSIPHGQA